MRDLHPQQRRKEQRRNRPHPYISTTHRTDTRNYTYGTFPPRTPLLPSPNAPSNVTLMPLPTNAASNVTLMPLPTNAPSNVTLIPLPTFSTMTATPTTILAQVGTEEALGLSQLFKRTMQEAARKFPQLTQLQIATVLNRASKMTMDDEGANPTS